MDSKSSEKDREMIKLIENIAEIIKGISCKFCYVKFGNDCILNIIFFFLILGKKLRKYKKEKKLFLVYPD